MRLIDADELLGMLSKGYETKRALDLLPTADPWHYPSKGEDIYSADLDWSITFFLCQMKDGKLATAFGCCDEDCEGFVNRHIDFCGENFDVLDTDDIYAWQYIVPPKEEA